jgi:transposase-like protein
MERPPYEQLITDVKDTNYVKTGKKYGVCDNTIRKWIIAYEKEQARQTTETEN